MAAVSPYRALRTRRGTRALAALAGVALAVAGCAVFAPAYDPMVDEKTTAAYEGVARLVADAERGRFIDKASFVDAVADRYSTVEAELSVAVLRVETAPVSSYGTGATARDKLKKQVDGCRARLHTMAELHRSVGITPKSGLSQPVLIACDEAVRAARALR